MISAEFTFTLKESQGVTEVLIEGSLLSAYDAKVLVEQIKKLIPTHNKFILNLKDVRYMNSEGLNVLLQILTRSRNAGGDTVVINLSTELKQLFIITKLNHIFTTANTKKEALTLLKKEAIG